MGEGPHFAANGDDEGHAEHTTRAESRQTIGRESDSTDKGCSHHASDGRGKKEAPPSPWRAGAADQSGMIISDFLRYPISSTYLAHSNNIFFDI